MENKLNAKDLINVGIYTALYVVVLFVVGMLNMIPVLYPFLYLAWPIVGAIPFMLFLTKINKFGMVTIMAIISAGVWFMMGYTWTVVATYLVCGIIADFIFKSGNYKSFKKNVIGYWVFSLSMIGIQLPMWITADAYMAGIREMMGDEYTDQLITFMPPWMGIAAIGIIFVGAFLGAIFGRKMLKKHFEKAGVA